VTFADIEQVLQEFPVQPPVVVPVMMVQEAVVAEDLPPLDADAANVFSKSKHILQDQSHLILCWLSSKLAAWISNNHGRRDGATAAGFTR
jgi:hypothetical protein